MPCTLMKALVARCNMLCRVLSSLLFNTSHSFAVQILLSHSLVEFVVKHFLVELTNRLFSESNFVLTCKQDREVLINYGLLKKFFFFALFKVSYVILKLHNSPHLLKMCVNNAERPKIIMTIIFKTK